MGKLVSIEREREVARMWLEGRTVSEMSRALGLATSGVKRLLMLLRARWQAEADTDYAARKAMELAKLDEVERKANSEWHRSRRPAQVVKRTFEVSAVAGASPDEPIDPFAEEPEPRTMVLTSETAEERGQCGNPAYLRVVKECVVERLKLIGAYEDSNATSLSPAQAVAMMNAAIQAVERRISDASVVQGVKEEIVGLLRQVTTIETAAVVCEPVSDTTRHDVSAGCDEPAEPPPEEQEPVASPTQEDEV